MSIHRWIDEEDVINIYIYTYLHTHTMEYYSAIRKEYSNVIYRNMDGPRGYQPKWSKSDRERQISYDITYMWNLKYDTNEITYKTETESQT